MEPIHYVMPILWLVLIIAFIIIEAITQGLTTIWFAGGSVIALFIAALHGPIWLQFITFAIVSCLLLIFTRPVLYKLLNGKLIKTNVETVVGEMAIVKEVINNLEGTGMVVLKGMEWSARTADANVVVQPEEKVRVKAVEGVKLIVEKVM